MLTLATNMTFYPKGVYLDNVTQQEFELYHFDDR
jgi:hypothetical protein